MKERILRNWTLQRALYLVLGLLIAFQAYLDKQWFGFFLGLYFASMGLLAFGCASGNCLNSSNSDQMKVKQSTHFNDVEFEEIKTK